MSGAALLERLRQLCDVVEAEVRRLALTDQGLFHEYIKDPAVLSDALNAAHDQVPALVDSALRLVQEAKRRLGDAAV